MNTETGTNTGDLVIFGAWFISHAIAEAAELTGWRVAGFIDPQPPTGTVTLRQYPRGASAIAAIGSNALRAFVCNRLKKSGRRLATVVHPSAVVSRSAVLGAGCYLGENAVVRSNATLGTGVFLNAGAVVSHDCTIGDCVTFGPNAAAASHVSIGTGTELGVGASVRPRAQIGCGCAIGAGAAVVEDIADDVTAHGVPARPAGPVAGPGRQSDWTGNAIW